MEKKTKKRIISIFIILIVTIVALPFILWQIQPAKNLDVIIMDKTVPDMTYREHKGFMWILNNLKIKNQNSAFAYSKDYYGFIPMEDQKYKTKELPYNLKTADMIYITDTYGVYNEEFYKKNIYGNRSELIYGGASESEVEVIKKLLNENVIIAEFNTLASPTEDQERNQMEDIFGLTWSGWIGRYFSDLSDNNEEIPKWIKTNYAMQYGVKWGFEGPGIVFVGLGDKIVVLREGTELGKGLNTIKFTPKAVKQFTVKNNVKYYYWFEVCKPEKDTEILANYKIDLTEKGKKVMEEFNLPSEFPAVLLKKSGYTSYYFCGDFADNNMTPKIYQAYGIRFLNKITTFDEDTNQNYFYWNVYYPLIKTIIEQIN